MGKGNLAEAKYVAEIESNVITNKPLLIKSGVVQALGKRTHGCDGGC